MARKLTWRSVRVQAGALVLAVALLLGGGIIAAQQVGASIGQLVAATTTARLQAAAAQDVLFSLQEAETGQRGFLLTQRTYYLEPYYQATSRIDRLLARMAELAGGTPWLLAEAAVLSEASRSKVAELEETVRLAQAQGITAALRTVLTDSGKVYMDAARASAARIIGHAEADRAARASLLQSRQQSVSTIVTNALGAGLVLLGAAALLLLWNRAQLLRAEERQRLGAARLQAAVEHIRDGVAVFDAEERLTLQNSRFSATIGLPPALASPGVTLARLAGELDMEPPALAGPRPGATPVIAEVRQKGRILEVWRSAMPDGGQMLAVGDITRRVEAEEIARQSQKMEVLGQMTGGIAHDFNNLLQVVSANLELVTSKLRRGGGDAIVLERLEAAAAGVARGARLTRHLLAFARRQPLAPEALDPARLLMSMEDTLRRSLGEAIALELVVGGGLWTMRADPNQMESALLNLALNARDAMVGEDGIPAGRLTIEVANAALDDQYAASRTEVAPGQYLMFAVTDTGSGMTPEQLARATEPFYTTKPEGKGTGLGLPMVFGFAKQSGGHFQLYSEPERGTTARLYIPRTSMALETAQHVAPAGRPANGELVLLVEDDPAVRLVASAALEALGYTVHEAASADEALALLKAGARPAVLFTDVVMPGTISSRELASQAVALAPGIAVLFTSGYTQNSIVHNGQLDQGVNLISKPWRTEDLSQALRAALDAARRPKPPPPPRRVLLVEDEPLVRMTTADALADLGFDVIEVGTGMAALERLKPAPDLMITDLGLPDLDGLELVAQARGLVPGLPVVVASGRTRRSAGGVVWLSKPYDGEGLRRAVEQALGAPKPISTTVEG